MSKTVQLPAAEYAMQVQRIARAMEGAVRSIVDHTGKMLVPEVPNMESHAKAALKGLVEAKAEKPEKPD